MINKLIFAAISGTFLTTTKLVEMARSEIEKDKEEKNRLQILNAVPGSLASGLLSAFLNEKKSFSSVIKHARKVSAIVFCIGSTQNFLEKFIIEQKNKKS
jgi:20S proteasome alpha/beta subunit